ncbi:MAG TPA: acyl-ACP--UDP-N-acetylglucosamine O-acyltransferase [Opitutus sp.]|nr:acyl-ACP--UDP-N-acetylglucosamine O-acyltransferase [Opitutus sp.]
MGAAKIHPTAVVEPGAQLGEDVEIGAHAYVGGDVTLGAGTRVHHHGCVEGFTRLGTACEVFPFASIGGKTQDLKFRGGRPGLRIGDRNVFREYVSVHGATKDGEFTTIGSDNVFLGYSHVAHDCAIGNHIVASNYVGLSGHITVEDHVVIGGMAGIHQFVRIGAFAMVGGMAKLVQDAPPYMITDGMPATVRTFNKINLERHSFTAEQIERVKLMYRVLYREGLNRTQALEKLAAHEQAASAEFQHLLAFTKASQRGLAPGV